MSRTSDLDWDAIEKDWRAGVLSMPEMAAKYNTTSSNIRNTAKRKHWVKDEAMRAGVRQVVVVKAARPHSEPDEPVSMEGVFEGLAEMGANILGSQRKDICKMRDIVRLMAKEMREQMENMPEIEEAVMQYFSAKAAMNPIQAGIFKQQMQQALFALGLGSRAKTMLNLTAALDRLIAMERTSYRLDDKAPEQTVEESIREIHRIALEKKQAGENRVN